MYLVLFKIGPVTVYSLGLLWALGALAAVWILRLELKRYGYDPEVAGSAGSQIAATILSLELAGGGVDEPDTSNRCPGANSRSGHAL